MPFRLKLFLLTLAIADDIGAIVVIAIFYSIGFCRSPGWQPLAGGLIVVALLAVPGLVHPGLRRARVSSSGMPRSVPGVHATIAGVAIGLLAPAKPLLGPKAFETIEDIITGERATPVAVREANWKMKESVSVTARLTSRVESLDRVRDRSDSSPWPTPACAVERRVG